MRMSFERFSLERAHDLGLKFDDLAILSYFIDFQNSGHMAYYDHQGERYYWVFYSRIVEEYPMLTIKSRDGIYRRFKKYVEVGLMYMVQDPESQRPHFRFDKDMLLSLLSYTSREKALKVEADSLCDGVGKISEGGRKNFRGGGRKNFRPDYTTICDSTTSDVICIVGLAQKDNIFRHWWQKYSEGLPDNSESRAEQLRQISMFAEKYSLSVKQLSYAVRQCVERDHPGQLKYLVGIMKKIHEKRFKDVTEPVPVQVEKQVKERIGGYPEMIGHWECDHESREVLYVLRAVDPDEARFILGTFAAVEIDIERQCGVRYRFRSKSVQEVPA